MSTITEIAKGFAQLIRDEHPDIRVIDTKYLSINEENIVKTSSYPYDLEDSKIVLVICFYKYRVITQQSSSFYVLFLDQSGWKDDFYKMNGWTISFDCPITSAYHTESRKCMICKGELKACFDLRPIYEMPSLIERVWPYLIRATECTSQMELSFLEEAFRKDIVIDKLKDKNLNLEYSLMRERSLTDAYKKLLDRIGELIHSNGAAPATSAQGDSL